MINKDTGNSRLRHYIRRDISYIDKHIEEVFMAILMLMWMEMNKMLTWITMTMIVMVNDDNHDADVDQNDKNADADDKVEL